MIENQEPQTEPKLIFGLSPKSTIINAVILAIIAQLSWAIKFIEQIPYGFDFDNPPVDFEIIDNVPWYYYIPFAILSLIMGINWTEYKFKLKAGDVSWRAIKYKFIYLTLAFMAVQYIAKFLCLFFLLLSFK